MAIQWHPLFAELLRPLLDASYEIQTNVAVGDAPRQADIVLLRRRERTEMPPFHGTWRHLTAWNVIEYKGPTVSARLSDLDLLLELGLGIHRRFNETQRREKKQIIPPLEVSFWYINNKVGKRFLASTARRLGTIEPIGEGIWRGTLLERPVFLVSGVDLPVEAENAPFHLLGIEPPDKESATAKLILNDPALLEFYAQFLGNLHPETLKELEFMARTRKTELNFSIKPLADILGLKKVIDQIGLEALIHEAGAETVIDEALRQLSVSDREALLLRLTRPNKAKER